MSFGRILMRWRRRRGLERCLCRLCRLAHPLQILVSVVQTEGKLVNSGPAVLKISYIELKYNINGAAGRYLIGRRNISALCRNKYGPQHLARTP